MTSDYDGAWKDLLQGHFLTMLRGYFPEIAEAIEPAIPPEFLDQELRELKIDETAHDNRFDLLVRVQMRDGLSQMLYLHLEVQSFPEQQFAERIFHCFAGLRRACGRDVISLAILADLDPEWFPGHYHFERLGCTIDFKFPCCKLLERLPAMEHDTSLPALAARAQIAALQSSRDPGKRLDLRWQLTRSLLEHGYNKEEIVDAYRMLSWMMRLPKTEFLIFRERVVTFNKDHLMQPLLDFEEYAMEKGLERGREEGLQTAILDLLSLRFKPLPPTITDQIQRIKSPEQLRELLANAARASNLDQFSAELRQFLPN